MKELIVQHRQNDTTIMSLFLACENNYYFTRRVTCDKVTRRMFISCAMNERMALVKLAGCCPRICPRMQRPALKSVRKTMYDDAGHKNAILFRDIRAEYISRFISFSLRSTISPKMKEFYHS